MSEIFIGCICFVIGCYFSEGIDKLKNKLKNKYNKKN